MVVFLEVDELGTISDIYETRYVVQKYTLEVTNGIGMLCEAINFRSRSSYVFRKYQECSSSSLFASRSNE